MKNDYFAKRLLKKLESSDPTLAAYEAQAVSRDVGFDFKNYSDVLPRALDEIREAKEANTEEGPQAKDHYGDELADIMFSLINLYRHAGLKAEDMQTIEKLQKNIQAAQKNKSILALDEVANLMKNSSEETAAEMYETAMKIIISTAAADGYDANLILISNVRKYLMRCAAIEKLAMQDSKNWSDLYKNNEIITYWKNAKALLN